MILLVLNPVCLAIAILIARSYAAHEVGRYIGQLIVSLIFSVSVIIYYMKRKPLFYPEEPQGNVYNPDLYSQTRSQAEDQEILDGLYGFCDKCGAAIPSVNSSFCRMCGSKVRNIDTGEMG